MYKILIKYPNDITNLWEIYGTTATSSADSKGTFTEFETTDVEVLKTEITKLDSMYGHDSIRIIKDVSYDVSVTIEKDLP